MIVLQNIPILGNYTLKCSAVQRHATRLNMLRENILHVGVCIYVCECTNVYTKMCIFIHREGTNEVKY